MYSNTLPLFSTPTIFCDSVIEISNSTDIEPGAIVTAFLTSFSLAASSVVEVEIEPGFVVRPVLFAQIIAESGFGKSILENKATTVFQEHEKNNATAIENEKEKNKGEMIIWEEKKKVLLAKLRKEIINSIDTSELALQIKQHEACKPNEPIADRLLLSDTTPAAAKQFFSGSGKVGGIFIPEGSAAYKEGRIFSDLGFLCNIWDGTTFHVDRANGSSAACIDPAAAMLVFTQPHVFQNFIAKQGQDMRSSGVIPRTLLYFAEQNKYYNHPIYYIHNKNHLEEFYSLIRSLLNQRTDMINTHGAKKVRLKFSPAARELYHRIKRQLKYDAQPTRPFEKFKDFVAKLTNNMMRIACLFHLMEKREGDIQADSVDFAWSLCFWYLQQAMIYFDENKVMTAKAHQLYDWIEEHFTQKNITYIEKTALYQYAPNQIRGKEKILPLLNILINEKKLFTEKIKGVGNIVRKFDHSKDHGF